jgi:hypothetical protein
METKDRKESAALDETTVDRDDSHNSAHVSRRHALILGLTAAPAVLSLMNRSAWAGTVQVSCTLVASYVNAGYRWQSPRPSNSNGTLAITTDDYARCKLPKP